MKIDRYNINFESIEDELPEDIEGINPIEEDQAVEIVNLHPTTKDLTDLTVEEKVLAIASDIEDNNQTVEDGKDVTDIFRELDSGITLEDSMRRNMEAYEILAMKPVDLSKDDLNANPLASREILLNEQQIVKNKANENTWGTIKEDCINIAKLIEASLETITSKKETLAKAVNAIDNGEIINNSLDLTTMLPTIGSLRYFLNPLDNNGPLVDLINILKNITDLASPKLSTADDTILKGIAINKDESITKAIEHIKNAMSTDALNVYLQNLVRNKPQAAVFSLYSRVTGGSIIEVLKQDKGMVIEDVTDSYKDFLINTANIDLESFKKELKDHLVNFEVKFKNLFLLHKSKYENLDKILTPLVMPNGLNQTEYERINSTLNLVRLYYIELVKNRIIDKLNAYYALLDISIRLFKVKG